MSKMTENDYKTFRQIYDNLPERSAVKAPKTRFVERIAALTKKSTKTVRCWLSGTQRPDALAMSVASLAVFVFTGLKSSISLKS